MRYLKRHALIHRQGEQEYMIHIDELFAAGVSPRFNIKVSVSEDVSTLATIHVADTIEVTQYIGPAEGLKTVRSAERVTMMDMLHLQNAWVNRFATPAEAALAGDVEPLLEALKADTLGVMGRLQAAQLFGGKKDMLAAKAEMIALRMKLHAIAHFVDTQRLQRGQLDILVQGKEQLKVFAEKGGIEGSPELTALAEETRALMLEVLTPAAAA